jgi:hypothetical protein
MEEIRNAYNILVGKPEGKRPRGRPRSRCVHFTQGKSEGKVVHVL